MTGYGITEVNRPPWRCGVEIHSVNRKQLDVVVNLPKHLVALERAVRQLVQERCVRGRISVIVRLEGEDETNWDWALLKVNRGLADEYARLYQGLREAMPVPVAPLDLVRAPGVFELREKEIDASVVWPVVELAVVQALDQLVTSREEEGRYLASVLEEGRVQLGRVIGAMRGRAPAVVERYRETLRMRLAEAGLPLPLDDERVMREIGLFAERADISEELARLESHRAQLLQYLRSEEAVGRSLDFIAQELNRELNTIASKANDAMLTQLVVEGKTEVERIREQVQNIE